MNKTVTINLGGIVFHIDEDAYQKLSRYFDAIKRSLNNSSGQEEIIKDIEMRISELLGEKLLSDKQDDLVFGIIILFILTPLIVTGLGTFGYYALTGEYDNSN